MSRKGVCPVCHFPSWGRGWDYSEMSVWDMTLSLSQASTSQLKTKASITLPLRFICVEINVCLLSSASKNEKPMSDKRSEFLETNGNARLRRDLIFRSLCSQPVKTVSWPSFTTVMVHVSPQLIPWPRYPHSQPRCTTDIKWKGCAPESLTYYMMYMLCVCHLPALNLHISSLMC